MVTLVRGCPTATPQKEGIEEPDRDSQQEDHLDAAEDKDIADYNLDIVYVGSEPEVEPVTQDERANMEIPHDGTLCQRMMP